MLRKTLELLALCTLMLGTTLSAHGQQPGGETDQSPSRPAIEAVAAKFTAGMLGHDAAAVASLFAMDGVLVSPFGVRSGSQAIQQAYEQLFRQLDVQQYEHVVELVRDAGTNRVYGAGRWNDLAVPPGKADPIHLEGYRGTLYEKQGDDWKIASNSWSLAPVKAPQPLAK